MMPRTFEQVMFCNFCHEKPAAGLIEEEEDGQTVGRAACTECAEVQGAIMSGTVVANEL